MSRTCLDQKIRNPTKYSSKRLRRGLLPRELLDLLHLTDAALPSGGFAFSQGLEAAFQLGLLRDPGSFRAYLAVHLEQVALLEGQFVPSFYRLTVGLGKTAGELVEELAAFTTVPSQLRASVALGRSWLRLFPRLYPKARSEAIAAWLAREPWPPLFPAVYGLTLAGARIPLEIALLAFLYMALRDQIQAGVRLGALGPLEAHALQHELHPLAARLAARAARGSHRRARRSAPVLDIIQGYHQELYSKLFQS